MKDNLLCVSMSDALNINKYLVWCHKQQREDYFGELNKVINAILHRLFYYHKFCCAWWKSKYSLANQQTQENGNKVIRNIITNAKKTH